MAYQKGRKNVPHRVHWVNSAGVKMSVVRPTSTQARSLLREVRKYDPKAYMEEA